MSSKKFKVYTASAGSGKTFQLTVDYLKIALRNPDIKFKKILAITFTKKATKEMKARIIEACKAFAEMNTTVLNGRNKALFDALIKDVDWSENEVQERAEILYKKIIHNYSDFAISTIDSFSQRLLRSFAFELNIPLNFEVQIDQSQTIDLIVARLLEKVGETDKALTKLVSDFFEDKLNEKDSIYILPDFVQAAKLMLDESSNDARQNLGEIELTKLVEINKEINKRYFEFKGIITQIGQTAISELEQLGLTVKDTSRSVASKFILMQSNPNFIMTAGFLKSSNGEQSWFKAKSAHKGTAIDDTLTKLGQTYFEILPKFKSINLVKQSFTKVALIAELYQLYKVYQQEEDIVLIAEFNQLISNEIKGQPAPFLYEKVGEQYQHILIDEFQDTSIIQWHNLTPLVTEVLSRPAQNDCIVVGDSKQAIYRFRGGETKQLTKLPDLIGSDSDEILANQARILDEHHTNVEMEFNYRSTQTIVEFNNLLYKFIAEHPDLLHVHDIFKTYYQKPFNQKGKGYVQLEFIEQPDKKVDEDTYDDRVAESVLKQLKSIEERNIPLGDVAILSRDKKGLKKMAELLTEHNYSIESQESLALNKMKFIQLFIALVELFYQNNNQILQAEVATGLAEFGVITIDKETLNKEIGLRKIKTMVEFDELMQQYNKELQFAAMNITEIMDMLERYVSWLPASIQQSDYISFFRNKVFEFVKVNGNNIEGFIDWWEQNNEKLYIESTPNPNAIKLLTIHKSKGLEFDIVLMPYINWKFKYDSNSEWLSVNEVSDLEVKNYYLSTNMKKLQGTSLEPIAEENIQNVLMDDLNLLYVATTRAVQELYIICEKASVSSLEKPTKISDIFNAFINDDNAMVETYGSQAQAEEQHHTEKQEFMIQPAVQEFGKAEVVVKNRSSVIWSEHVREKIDYGEIIHSFLEQIKTKQDITLVTSRAINEGIITDTQSTEIQQLLNTIVEHDELKEYFNTNNNVLAEQSILTPGGEEYIPDRMLIEDNTVKIIDFKTGEKNTKHKAQLNNYANLLTQMNYNVVEQKIVYVNPLIIETI